MEILKLHEFVYLLSYKEHYKAYTPDFELLGADLPCPVERAEGKIEMVCSDYTFSLAEGSTMTAMM